MGVNGGGHRDRLLVVVFNYPIPTAVACITDEHRLVSTVTDGEVRTQGCRARRRRSPHELRPGHRSSQAAAGRPAPGEFDRVHGEHLTTPCDHAAHPRCAAGPGTRTRPARPPSVGGVVGRHGPAGFNWWRRAASRRVPTAPTGRSRVSTSVTSSASVTRLAPALTTVSTRRRPTMSSAACSTPSSTRCPARRRSDAHHPHAVRLPAPTVRPSPSPRRPSASGSSSASSGSRRGAATNDPTW